MRSRYATDSDVDVDVDVLLSDAEDEYDNHHHTSAADQRLQMARLQSLAQVSMAVLMKETDSDQVAILTAESTAEFEGTEE